MTYFKHCKTIEDVKATFKELAKKLHPDCGGNAEEFKAMMQEYKIAFDRLKNIHTNSKGETYESKKASTETAEQFAEIIGAIIHLEGIKIEIIGTWVWVTGNTYEYRGIFKQAGFTWSKSKKAWYHAGEKLEGKRRGQYTMKQLRSKWGTEEIETEKQERIA